MKHHRLTGTELNVSCFCQGAAPFGTMARGTTMQRLYDLFREAGGNFFDTAHCYAYWIKDGLGASERALGECLRSSGDRDQVVIATKGGLPDGGASYPRPAAYLAPAVIASDIQESLERLAVDQIDLYYLHRDDLRVPVGEIIDILNAEIARGRLRSLGASNWTTARIEAANAYAAAHGLQGFVASQPQWNLAHSNGFADPKQHSLTPADEEWHQLHQLPVVPYSPTACGYFASGGQRAKAAFDNHISRARLERAEHLAVEMHVTPTQIALAWLLSQPFPVIPILGTTQPDHLTEALGAAEIQLSPEQVLWLRG